MPIGAGGLTLPSILKQSTVCKAIEIITIATAILVMAYFLRSAVHETVIKPNHDPQPKSPPQLILVNVAKAESLPTSTDPAPSFSYDLVDALHVKNPKTIKKLIKCESNGENVTRPDSNGLLSRGILQYNDGAHGLKDGTWADFSHLSGIKGTPENLSDAILMTDWAINHGFLHRWSCARILGLVN